VTRSKRLTSFDIANQRSLHDLDEAVIAPAREWLLSHDARQGAERMIDAMAWGAATFATRDLPGSRGGETGGVP